MQTTLNFERVQIASLDINAAGLWGLREKVERLNRRAKRLNMTRIDVTIAETYQYVANKNNPNPRSETRYKVRISGVAPVVAGYRLIARIEFNGTIGQVVRIAPGIEDNGSFAQYRTIAPVCEHCNTNRRRNDVYVLQHDNGSRKIVGRNCLADFVRDGDAASLAAFAEHAELLARLSCRDCEEMGEERGYGSRVKPVMSLAKYLPIVAMVTRRMGWLGRTKARDTDDIATADNVSYYLYGRGRSLAEFIRSNELYLCDEDTELAGKAIEWAKGLADCNEYQDVIRRIAISGDVEMDSLDGYAASILIAYQMDQERTAERNAQDAPKEFIGSVKERLRGVVGKVVRTRFIDGHYGVKTIVALEVDMPSGSVAPVVWFASGSKNFDDGAVITFDATIKEHKDDRYGKQTVVNRLTVK